MIGYLGPRGSFTHQALLAYLQATNNTSTLDCFEATTISQVIDAVNNGKIKYGVVPVENSIEGAVGETLDQLIRTSQKVTINHEIIIPIEHCLITKTKNLNEITKVIAHSQALSQCQSYLKRFLPNVELEPTTSNSIGVKRVSELTNGNVAAIGPKQAAEIYKVPVYEAGINDEKENFTRFTLIGTETPEPTGLDKTTIAFGVPYDKPGTLVRVLNSFASNNINLTRIESRPSKKALGEYIFFIDLEGHRNDPSLKKALSEVVSDFSFYRWLGSYPRWNP
ncbi:MAG: prephenate dehydratase [Candidatus Melainabacteria bacterium]|nr:prephenate dehydratase [Candidatus Melainabacteria bacterium]MBI3307857.1 prephenate dehydratase [Candidatus Melainabacteria bacterium]